MAKTVEEPSGLISGAAQDEVRKLLDSSLRRNTTPLRYGFVRHTEAGHPSPLARVVSKRGRGGDVALKLYLGLVRRSSRSPFDTNLSARRWATLLDLDDPSTSGSRRIRTALGRLEEAKLIKVTNDRGAAPTVTLLREDGSGDPYRTPSEPQKGRRYFQVPDSLWDGRIQTLSAPALTLLLVLLAEPQSRTEGMWWSVGSFTQWYGLSDSTRTRGSKELKEAGLIHVKKQMLDTPRGQIKTANGDERDRVRNLYLLKGDALRR